MKILIVGAGVVGLTTGRGFARFEHEVTFYDTDAAKLEKLRLEGYNILGNHAKVNFNVVFVCTPEQVVKRALQSIPDQKFEPLKVVRSTVALGTIKKLKTQGFTHLCHNPEFFRQAHADYEFMNPHRIVIGECCKRHGDILERLYQPFLVPIIRVKPEVSTMIKLTSNAYLTMLISFWNEIHGLCEKTGVNSYEVSKACTLDPRISIYGSSWHGKPFKGACLPKDLQHLISSMKSVGLEPRLLEAVKEVNENI